MKSFTISTSRLPLYIIN